MTPDELLAIYDDQVRGSFASRTPTHWTLSQDGPLTRCVTGRRGFAMATPEIGSLSREELVGLVDRTIAYYTDHGLGFEWKTYDHDRGDLVELLVARGFEPEEHEALVLGETDDLAAAAVLPDGIAIRQVRERVDLERIGALESEVWGEDWSFLVDDLAGRVDDPQEPALILVAEDLTGPVPVLVSAAWLVPLAGTGIAGLWGGSTLAAYRGRGIYRALVATRATLARDLGFPLLQVDASDDSRPILERLGLHVVGGTTPYLWSLPTPPG